MTHPLSQSSPDQDQHCRRSIPISSALLLGLSVASAPALAEIHGEAGWYFGARGAHSMVDDANNTTGGGGGGTAGCALELPGLGCVIPGAGGGTGDDSFESIFADGMDWELAIGRQFRNGLRTDLSLNWLQNDIDKIRASDGSEQDSDSELEALGLMANAWFDYPVGYNLVPYIGGGLGARKLEVSGGNSGSADDTVFGYQLGAGLGWAMSDRLALSLDYRYLDGNDPELEDDSGSSFDSEFSAQTIGLSLRYLFIQIPHPDDDGDGVVNHADNCPGTAAGISVDDAGCTLDTDGDGVNDPADQCPSTPSGTPVDSKGCARDSDNDGVNDLKDQCPSTPAGVRVDSSGCALDSDGDGVRDGIDECPNSKRGSKVMSNGCASLVLEGVQFETNSARLLPEAQQTLREAAEALKSAPGFNVEVQGHTDDLGAASYNQRLSQRRADAVRQDLIARGVAASRLTAKGYGESQPKVANKGDASRAINRRVELKVLSK